MTDKKAMGKVLVKIEGQPVEVRDVELTFPPTNNPELPSQDPRRTRHIEPGTLLFIRTECSGYMSHGGLLRVLRLIHRDELLEKYRAEWKPGSRKPDNPIAMHFPAWLIENGYVEKVNCANWYIRDEGVEG